MVKSAMSGSNDIRGKRGTIFLAEILRLQVDVFAFSLHNAFKNTKLEKNRISLQNLCQNHNPKTTYSWEQYQEPMEEFLQAFNDFVENGCLRSKSFQVWNTFLNFILLILINVTRSHYEEDWNLHISALRRVLPLFFVFKRKK